MGLTAAGRAMLTSVPGDSRTRDGGRDVSVAYRMRRRSLTEIETLVEEVSRLYADLGRTGIRAIDALGLTDPDLVAELLAMFESRDRAAIWIVRRMAAFGGYSALEMLWQGEREPVMSVLHVLRVGMHE